MFETLKLLLPAIIPSWRFFDSVTPSPRIEFTLLKTPQDVAATWQEFRPRPIHLDMETMLKRLFWNPRWNETLFLASCAERIMENETEHSNQEIVKRIRADLRRDKVNLAALPYFQFRLVFVNREETALQRHITFISQIYPSSEGAFL